MRHFLFIFFCLLVWQAQAQETYTMTIDGNSFPVELNKEFTYITESGDSVIFQLQKSGSATPAVQATPQNTFANTGNDQVYEDLMIRFTYPENFSIAKTQPVNGMQQITMVSGQGGGILIQEYSSLNPRELVDFYLSQLVGEDATSRAKKVDLNIDGQKVNGKFTRDADDNKVVVYSYGKAKQGILLALIGEDADDELLRNFVQSLQLKF